MFNIDGLTNQEFEVAVVSIVAFKTHLEKCIDEPGFYDEEQKETMEAFVEQIDSLLFKLKQIKDNKSTLQ